MEVDGLGSGKDFALYPGGGHAWDWSKHGTSHDPGIQPGDVEDLLDHGATTIVLSGGMEDQLKTMPETMRLLEERGIEVRVERTADAVEAYNSMAKTQQVGGLFHSTC